MKKDEKYCAENDPLTVNQEALFARIETAVKEKDVILIENKLSSVFTSQKRSIASIAKLAALFLAILSISFVAYYYSSPYNIRLYNKYYETYECQIPANNRDINTSHKQAFKSYKENKFNTATNELSAILSKDPANFEVLLLLSISNIELKRFSEAKANLLKIIEAPLNFYSDDALWYFSLIQIRNNELNYAYKTLKSIEMSSDYYTSSQELLRKIDDTYK